MWGLEPVDSAIAALELFKSQGLRKILIPGFGYGRNAKVFIDKGFDVTGIEISETAIGLSKQRYGDQIRVYHGSVNSMPFDKEIYDGVFCYALIHLLGATERKRLIENCYRQLKQDGFMIFIAISKNDSRFGVGKKIDKDTYETKFGIPLFFYDADSVQSEFGDFNLIEAKEINEPAGNIGDRPPQRFWQIACKRNTVIE